MLPGLGVNMFPSLGMGGSISDGLGGNSPSMQDPLYTDKLGKKIKGKGRNFIQNLSLKSRSWICPKWSVFIVTNMGISLLTVLRRGRTRRLLKQPRMVHTCPCEFSPGSPKHGSPFHERWTLHTSPWCNPCTNLTEKVFPYSGYYLLVSYLYSG